MLPLIQQHRAEIEALCRRYGVRRLEVFGSAATGAFKPGVSDIDLLVEYDPGADLGPWMGRFTELREELEKLLGVRVDLVMATEFCNPYFRASVEKSRRLVYAA